MLLNFSRLGTAPSAKRVVGTLKRLYNEAKEDDVPGSGG